MFALRVLTVVLAGCMLAVSPAAANLAFRPPINLGTGGLVAVGDFNHDGAADIVTAREGAITVRLNSGDATFTVVASVMLPWTTNAIAYVTTGDINGDGHLDAIATHHNGHAAVALGDGAGGLSPPVISLRTSTPLPPLPIAHDATAAAAVADFNGDGLMDAAVPALGTSVIWLYRGGGGGLTFDSGFTLSSSPGLYTAAAGDLNGDGFADLAVGHPDGETVSVLISLPVHPLARSLTMNNYFFARRKVSIWPAAGPGGPPPRDLFSAASVSLTFADVTGDGALDIVAAHANVTPSGRFFSVLANDGHGAFAPAGAYTTLGAPWHPAVADIDGDGHADVVVTNPYSWAATVHRGQGGVFDAAWADVFATGGPGDIHNTLTTGRPLASVSVADFNRDGRLDLLIGSFSNASIFLQGATVDGPPRAHLDAVITELALTEAQASSIATEVTDLSAANAAIQAQSVTAAATLAETQAKLATVLQQAHALQQEREAQDAARTSQQQQIDATRAQGTNLRTQVETLTTARAQLDAEAASVAAATGAREQHHATAVNRRDALLGEQATLRATGESLHAQLRSAVAARPSLALQLAAAHLELVRIRATVRQARRDHDREQRLLDELRRRTEQLTNAIHNGGRR